MNSIRTFHPLLLLAWSVSASALPSVLPSQEDAAPAPVPAAVAFSAAQQRGVDWLLKQQEGGRFFMSMPGRGGGKPQKRFDVGLTGLCLAAVQTKPAASRSDAEKKVIDQGLNWLLTQQTKAGSFGQRTVVYSTSSVVFALTRSGRKDCIKSAERARRFLQALQNTEQREYAKSDVDYGSFGYGNDERGDLSNTTFAIQAMRDAGLPPDDEGLAKALVFLQKLQNLRSVNTLEQTTKDEKTGKTVKMISGDDGGATYYPGKSPAGYQDLPDGSRVPRSYGSMTYALLKTYTLCGIDKDDKRIQAALDWASSNWSVDINPGSDPKLGEAAQYQGLFYYYMVMAQALDVAGAKTLTPPVAEAAGKKGGKPQKIDWQKDLATKLASLQAADGSWRNGKNSRWYEGLSVICTAYAMLALEHCG